MAYKVNGVSYSPLAERIGLARLGFLAGFPQLKSGCGRLGRAAIDNKVFHLLAGHVQKLIESGRKSFARCVGDDKWGGQRRSSTSVSQYTQRSLQRCCEGSFDDIELVGGVLPFGRIGDDAIGVAALNAGADGLGVDRILWLGETAGKLMQRFVLMQMQQQ